MCTVFGLLLLGGVVLIVTDLTFSLFICSDSYHCSCIFDYITEKLCLIGVYMCFLSECGLGLIDIYSFIHCDFLLYLISMSAVLYSSMPLIIMLKSQMLLWPVLICWCSVSSFPRAGLILVLSLLQATHTGMRSYIYKQSSVIGSQAEHTGMRTYYFSADTQEDMNGWVRAMNQAALMQTHTVKRSVSHKTLPKHFLKARKISKHH